MISLVLALTCCPVPAQVTGTASPPAAVGTVIPGGSVAGTWTRASSPYLVLHDITVDTLVVEAGVEVRSSPGVEIRVLGSITTKGTQAQPVLFTSRTPGGSWRRLVLFFASGTSSFTYTRFERASDVGLLVQASRVEPITHCEFVSNNQGVWITTTAGDAVLRDCLIENNILMRANNATGAGVVANIVGTFTMERCTVRGNLALASPCGYASGGGIAVLQAAEVFLTDVLVENNACRAATGLGPVCSACSPEAGGGGIALGCPYAFTFCSPPADFDATLTRCIVRNNSALSARDAFGDCTTLDLNAAGGGISYGCPQGTLALRNVIGSGNVVWADGETETSQGGALYFDGRTLLATNCTFVRNLAVEGQAVPGVSLSLSPGIHMASGGAASEIRNSVLYDNWKCTRTTPPTVGAVPCPGAVFAFDPIQGPAPVAVAYSDVQGGEPGTGNLDVPPLFSGPGTTYADLSLLPGSPLVDAGDPAPLFDDLFFPPSLGTARNDIGASGGPFAGGWILTGN